MYGNCIHCGAPVQSELKKCPYCGCEYENKQVSFSAKFNDSASTGVLVIGNEEIQVYIGDIIVQSQTEHYVNAKGQFCQMKTKHRKFSLIEK